MLIRYYSLYESYRKFGGLYIDNKDEIKDNILELTNNNGF